MALAHAIMTALLEDELSGYELARDFDKSMDFFWHASHQQIYQELRKLLDRGWLRSRRQAQKGKPARILYSLTRSGRKGLSEWVFAPTRTQAAKDELLLKLYNLADDNVEHLAEEIASRREQMMQRLYSYETIRRQHYARPADLPLRRQGVYLALLQGISQGEQFLAWCDEALSLLAATDTNSV